MAECVIVGTVKDVTGTAGARPGTRLTLVETKIPGVAHAQGEKLMRDFYVTSDGTLATAMTGGAPAKVSQGAWAKFAGDVRGFHNGGAWVLIPNQPTVDINALADDADNSPPPQTALSESTFDTHVSQEQADRAQGDADTLSAAHAYTDAQVGAIDLSPFATTGALTAEADARTSADSTLQANITAEATARTNGDSSALASANSYTDTRVAAEAADRDGAIATASAALQDALDTKAPLDSPALAGTPTAPTVDIAVSNTQLATTAFVHLLAASLINGAPEALNQLNELAAALGNDPNFATTMLSQLGGKLAKSANLSDLTDVAAAHASLQLGALALLNSLSAADVGLGNVTDDAQVKAAFSGYASKATPADADAAVINDSAAAGAVKRLTWANLKAALKTYFDAFYKASPAMTGVPTIEGSPVSYLLCQSAVAVSAPANTSENVLFTCTIPANALGPNGGFRLSLTLSCTNNANAKTVRVRYSGAAGTQLINFTSSGRANINTGLTLRNRGAANSQVVTVAADLTTTSALATSAVDTTQQTTLVITGQKGVAGDSLTLELITVEIFPGP